MDMISCPMDILMIMLGTSPWPFAGAACRS